MTANDGYIEMVRRHASKAIDRLEVERMRPYNEIAKQTLLRIIAEAIHDTLVEQERRILDMERPELVLFTDGSGNQLGNPGGWAAILVGPMPIAYGTEALYQWAASGYYPNATNQRMELAAILHGLERVESGSRVEVRTDSEWAVRLLTYMEDGKGGTRTVYQRRDPFAQGTCYQIEETARQRDLEVRYTHVYGHDKDRDPANRHWNGIADALAYQTRMKGEPVI